MVFPFLPYIRERTRCEHDISFRGSLEAPYFWEIRHGEGEAVLRVTLREYITAPKGYDTNERVADWVKQVHEYEGKVRDATE